MLPTLSPAPPEAPDRGVPIRAAEAMAYGLWFCGLECHPDPDVQEEGRDQDEDDLSVGADAQARLAELATQATTKARRFAIGVKGKTLRHRVGDKIRLNRTKGLVATSGTFGPVVVRILGKLDNYPGWSSEVTLSNCCREAHDMGVGHGHEDDRHLGHDRRHALRRTARPRRPSSST
jgi:hypothetical protein